MFFGNFKPRVLKLQKKQGGLFMSYWYVNGAVAKNEFELVLGDRVESKGKGVFEVSNKEEKYVFKVEKEEEGENLVERLNKIIISFF